MEVAPKKAKERREAAARDTRVERWIEDSGNAALMGCELPPDEVLAADQRITAWAKELRQAGLEGDMDQLRARAYLDLLLGQDSRSHPGGAAPPADPAAAGPAGGPVPAGFAGRVTLTVPLATLAGLADRPGDLAGLGPVDPWLSRDLGRAAARNPKSTWCLTVTDDRGTPSVTAARVLNPGVTGNAPAPARRMRPGSPSPRPAGIVRPMGTAPGGCAPPGPDRT